MPSGRGSLPTSNTGDGDLGMLAMESPQHETLGLPADALTAIPTYPSPRTRAKLQLAQVPHAAQSTGAASDGQAPGHILGMHVGNARNGDASTQHGSQLASASSLTSSLSSSRLGALSLEEKDLPGHAADPSGVSSTLPTSLLIPNPDPHSSQAKSISSSSSNYTSATESPISERNTAGHPPSSSASAAPAPAPEQQQQPSTLPSTSTSHRSIASNSTITQSRLPTSRSLSSTQAVSLEQELDANQSQEPSSAGGSDAEAAARSSALSARSSRRSRRSGVPPLGERLPVGAGGPSAPPRTASFRDASKRTSVGAGHGDIGTESYGPSSPSMTSFLDLDSPRTSESSHAGPRSVPSRRTSLHAPSPRTPTFPINASSMQPSSASASSSATQSYSSQASSRPTSSSSKAAPAGLTPAPPLSRSASAQKKAGSAAPVSKLNLDREAMQRWVLSVGCVNFDLELGPDLEFLYPPLGISREERDNIAFSSFPDTSIFDDGSLVFSWRVREVPLESSGSEAPTIKSIGDALQQPLDDQTPRPSMNKAALQNATAKAQKQKNSSPKKGAKDGLSSPTSPTLGSSSGFGDSSESSAASGKGLSRKTSDANLDGSSMPASTSFHERLTQKLFSSSGGSSMARHFSHDRHSSNHSMASSVSADDDGDATANAPASQAGHGTATGSATLAPSSAGQTAGSVAMGTSSSQSSDLLAPKRANNSTSSSYIYGYVFFRQKRDPTNRRGYFQKSVVILSHLPLVGLFSEVVARLGPLYFEHGMSMFEAFANDIMHWPAPVPGTILTLPLLGSIITAAIPFGQQPQNSPNATAESTPMASSLSAPGNVGGGFKSAAATMTIRSRSRQNQSPNPAFPQPMVGPEGPLLASIPSTSLFTTFKEALADLWLLWECVLLAEPILVIAPEPKIASEAVWHMLDLIRPIPYAGDFRPYFHIHDYDFRTLVTKNKPQAGTLVAATNPFMATACGHWPHVLRVGKAAVKLITFKHGGSVPAGSGKKPGGPAGGGIGGGTGAGGGGPDHIPGFTTKRKRRISKDRALLKRLQDLAKGGSDETAMNAANVTMRRYFADLTERFLAPLNRYVASLVPASFDLSSPSEVPKIRPFNTTDFLASLKAHGTPLAIRSRSLPTGASVRQSLYLDFLKCPNFSLWLHSRVAAAEEEQRRRYISVLLQGDVTAFGTSRGEIETIDLYSRLVEEIRLVDVQLTAPTEPGPGSRWRTDKPTTNKQPSSGRGTPTSMTGTNNATSAATTEKRLIDQKKRLMQQLEKLCQTLPADLRSSLRRPN